MDSWSRIGVPAEKIEKTYSKTLASFKFKVLQCLH